MRKATFASIRAHIPRLIAVSLAILLAVGFMSAAFVLNSSTKATLRASVGEQYAKAGLVLAPSANASGSGTGGSLTDAATTKVAAVDGVDGVFVSRSAYFRVSVGGGQYFEFSELAPDQFRTATLQDGAFPTSATQVAVSATTASQYGIAIGDRVSVTADAANSGDSSQSSVSSGSQGGKTIEATVVGILRTSSNPNSASTGGFTVTSDFLNTIDPAAASISYGVGMVGLSAGANQASVASAITAVLPSGFAVYTPDEYAARQLSTLTGGADLVTGMLMVFVGIALLVCGLVISNTLAVLVSQRTRELALLRCLGASTQQVYRSVLVEAFVLAVCASVLGVVAGVSVMAVLINAAGWGGTGGNTAQFSVDANAVIWPVLAGVVVTLLGALGPARQSTRVAPLQALRPVESIDARSVGTRARLIVGLALIVVGVGILLACSVLPAVLSPTGIGAAALATFFGAFVGSALSVLGAVMLAVFYVPWVIRIIGGIVGRCFGVAGRLATLNSVRNPRRTAATATALLIGVGLVATILTAGQVARATLGETLNTYEPIDMTVQLADSSGASVSTSAADLTAMAGIPGVDRAVTMLYASNVTATSGGQEVDGGALQVIGVQAANYTAIARISTASNLHDGVALVGEDLVGKDLTFVGANGQSITLPAVAGGPKGTAVLTESDYSRLGAASTQTMVALRLDDGLSTSDILTIRDRLTTLYPSAVISGGAIVRSGFEQIIDTLLLVVTGLLAVAVIIALIGVSNTLSLSVIERTRENAMLRSLGLTRGQLRGMLAIEALLVAGIAALLGTLLGVGYGVLGAVSLFTAMGGIVVSVPWMNLVAVVAVAALAGVVASIGPARRAARLSPIEGLATT